MPHKSNNENYDETASVDSSDKELEAKIDAMLDPHEPEKPPEQPEVRISDTPQVVEDAPPLDIFKEAKGAPELKKVLEDEGVQKETPAATEIPAEEGAESGAERQPDEADAAAPSDDTKMPDANPESPDEPKPEVKAQLDAPESGPEKTPPAKTSKVARVRRFFARWWHNKRARYATITVVLVLLVAAVAWPTSRYFLLNTVGVRSGASLSVVDGTTGLPLRGVTVAIGATEVTTDADGAAKFSGLKLGKQDLQIQRVAFASLEKQVTLGWGSNPLGAHSLQATGAQYRFVVTDHLSGKPITSAEATSDTASAYTDKNGKITLTVDDPTGATLEVSITAPEYRTETIQIGVKTTEPTEITMVPAQPVVYVSKQSGTYDVFRVDADGENEKLLLPGTGRERDNLTLLTSPDGEYAALVSSRENTRDSDGFLLESLTLIDVNSGKIQTVDRAQSLRIVEWRGSKLVYRAAYAAASAATNERQRIIVYDVEDKARTLLVKGNNFRGVVGLHGYVYYVVNSPGVSEGLFARIRLDGSGKQSLLDERCWLLLRTNTDVLHVQSEQGWHSYDTNQAALKPASEPANYRNHAFTTSPAGTETAWIDTRDGQNVLLVRAEETGEDTNVVAAPGISGPVQWLGGNTLSYYVDEPDQGTAVYVVSLDGGEPRRMGSATLVNGISPVY